MRKTVFISGGTRGVGLEIAKKFANDGANIVIIGKTVDPHPKLPGTLSSAAAEIKAAGGHEVLAIPCDVRDLVSLESAVHQAGIKFGVIDILVNNASALYLINSQEINPNKFNLMYEVIVRASFFATQFALPYLKQSRHARVIHLAPPILLEPKWFKDHTVYTLCKYSSSMLVIGLAEEYRELGIVVNAIWPKTLLSTAAVQNLLGGDEIIAHARHPRIVADAVHYLVAKPDDYSGKFHLDEDILNEHAIDLNSYNIVAGNTLINDFYIADT